jgi:hypothetical protein
LLSSDNINILKSAHHDLYQVIRDYREPEEETSLIPGLAKNGLPILSYRHNDFDYLLHSGYDPEREARIIIDGYEKVESYEQVIFFGAGLGYHIKYFQEKYPQTDYHIYEPFLPVLYRFFQRQPLGRHMRKAAYGIHKAEMEEFIAGVISKYNLIIDLPAYRNACPEVYKDFMGSFRRMVNHQRHNFGTVNFMQQQWSSSVINNFAENLKNPNILTRVGQFKGKTAIIAAAGPSLTEEIGNLRYIKEHDLAYIFSVGSSINALIEQRCYPHAFCSIDPQQAAAESTVFARLIKENITEIPLIYATSAGFPAAQYPGGVKMHMVSSADHISPYYLRLKGQDTLPFYYDAPSVAVATVELLYKLGFSAIIFVGQNLAFKDDQAYAEGIEYSGYRKQDLKVPATDGGEVYTNDSFNIFRHSLEGYIQAMPEVEFINATKGGAVIEGAPFTPLSDIINGRLRKPEYDSAWLDMSAPDYDLEYARRQKERMEDSYLEAGGILGQIDGAVKNMARLYRNQNFSQLDKTITKMGGLFNRLDAADFAQVYLYPVNQVYCTLLVTEIREAMQLSNLHDKAIKIITECGKFYFICQRDYVKLKDSMAKVHDTIEAAALS